MYVVRVVILDSSGKVKIIKRYTQTPGIFLEQVWFVNVGMTEHTSIENMDRNGLAYILWYIIVSFQDPELGIRLGLA